MANATATLKALPYPKDVDTMRTHGVRRLQLTIAAGNYVTNGLPISWIGLLPDTSATQPDWVEAQSVAGNIGVTYQYDQVHNTIRIASGGTELTAGSAIAGSITGDTVYVRAEYPKGF